MVCFSVPQKRIFDMAAKLGQLLITAELITEEQLKEAVGLQRKELTPPERASRRPDVFKRSAPPPAVGLQSTRDSE